MEEARGMRRRSARRLAMGAALAGTIIAGLAYWRILPDERAPDAGIVHVKPTAAPTLAVPSPVPTPVGSPVVPLVPGPMPGPPFELKVTSEVLAALKLPSTAKFRDTTIKDADDRVICGEVALSPRDTRFRRFVYIAGSKAGFVDDGGPAFEQINAATCAVGN